MSGTGGRGAAGAGVPGSGAGVSRARNGATAARDWLLARAHDVPAALVDRMLVAVDAAAAGAPAHQTAGGAPGDGAQDSEGPQALDATAGVPRVLGDAAVACLREAVADCDDRAAAIHLLAADALVTAACEAAVEDGSLAALRALCDEFEVRRLAARLSAGRGGHDA